MKRLFLVVLALISLLMLWQAAVALGWYPHYILPAPADVLARLLTLHEQGSLLRHVRVTLGETLGGFALSALVALVLGYLTAHKRTLHLIVHPYVIALQAIPVIAIAPLMVIWFGYGATSKIIVAALIAFLPVFMGCYEAFGALDRVCREDMRLIGGNWLRLFAKLEWPSALPAIAASMRIGISLALMGAVVAEFVGARAGLGFLISFGKGTLDTELVFGALILLVGLGLTLYALATLSKSAIMKWRQII